MLSADTARFVVDVNRGLWYLPGQFVLLEFADGVRRAYSMTRRTCHDDPAVLEFLVRAKPGGAASAWLFERLDVGAELRVEGPYGKAYAQSPPDRPVLCLAGGTGLAPVLAITEQLLHDAPERDVVVYSGSRRVEDVVLADRLAALADSGARIVAVIEDNPNRAHPRLGLTRTGIALDHLARDWPEMGGHDLYLAGPTPMIDAALRRLVRFGTARADQVFFDRFIA
jgi:ferredoxin-NADP reductase